jgi:TonB-linked SusC/RagA family outer membrane protein
MQRTILITASITASLFLVPSRGSAYEEQQVALGEGSDERSLLARPAHLVVREVPMSKALKMLSETSGAAVAFSPSQVAMHGRTVTCECASATVGHTLDYLLDGSDLTYVVYGGQILIYVRPSLRVEPVVPAQQTHLAQQILSIDASSMRVKRLEPLALPGRHIQAQVVGTVAGQVRDSRTGEPMSAVQVFIAQLDLGVLTQQNGRYVLLNVPAGSHELTVQRIGYAAATRSVTVGDGEAVVENFDLVEEALQLDEVIVTGTPGGTQRRAIGNTVTTLDVSSVVQDAAVTNFQDLLSGRGVGGVRFTRLAGNVGTGSPLTLRGAGSFNLGRSQPLIYVDGVRVNNDSNAGPQLSQGSQVNVLNDFNPADIESIEIIKGPAAASLYGTEASAGVIQIITKKGRQGAPEFNVAVREGVNYMPDPAGRLGTFHFCPSAPSYGCTSRDELEPYNMYEEATRYIAEGYFPWPSENLYSYGHSRAYDLDVRGGGETIRYFVSGSYGDDQGYTYFNRDEKYRFRGNLGVTLTENFSLDVSTGLTNGFTRFGDAMQQEGGIWQDMIWSKGYFLDRNRPWGTPGSNPRLGGFQERLPPDHELIEQTRDYTRFTGSATVNFQSGDLALAGMSASVSSRAVVGLDKGWDINQRLWRVAPTTVPEHLQAYTDQWLPTTRETATGRLEHRRPVNRSLTFDYSITGRLEVNEAWSLSTSAGAQYYENQLDEVELEGRDFASPVSTTINQTSSATLATEYELVTDKSLGFYVQQEVGWNDRIFVTGAVRFDDNSTFGAEAPARRYPKVSGTWVVSEESFWNVDWINSLRLRGAWGQAGRQPTAIAGFNTYAASPGPRGTSAIRPESPGNPGVEPEVSTEIEVGFDAAFLQDRISAEFTHYWRKDDNLLLSVPVLGSFGIPGSVDRNVGQMASWGWEAHLSTRVYQSEMFSFDLDLTADYTDNEIRELDEPSVASQSGGVQIGLPYPGHVVRAYVTSAEFDPAGSLANVYGQRIRAMCDMGVFLGPHDPSDPNLTREQLLENSKYGKLLGGEPGPCGGRQYLWSGRAFATHTFSVAPRVSLFNNQLQIFALAEGQYGRWAREDGKAWTHIDASSAAALTEDDPWWAAMRRLNDTSTSHEKHLFDADFWKLREVGARYSLPESLIEPTPFSRASLSVSARNVWTIWVAQKYISGLRVTDPEFGAPSNLGGTGSFWEMPPMANINVTLRVTF